MNRQTDKAVGFAIVAIASIILVMVFLYVLDKILA
jgi:hypothetical protein